MLTHEEAAHMDIFGHVPKDRFKSQQKGKLASRSLRIKNNKGTRGVCSEGDPSVI